MVVVLYLYLWLVFCVFGSTGLSSNFTISNEHLEYLIQKGVEEVVRKHSVRGQRSIEPPVFTRCPNGYVRHDDSCYIASHDLANWPDALVYCDAYGAHLAFVESEREQQFLTGYIHNLQGSATDPQFYYWLGGTDAVSEGEWIWAKAVKPIQYTNWTPGEPNNNAAHSSKHQDCLGIYGKTGLWDDGWCETEHNFICEIELDNELSQIVG